jgi:hypothetical protein
MSNAYFVSRTELLQWLNDSFNLSYKTIQDCGNGTNRYFRYFQGFRKTRICPNFFAS